jgi:hypothetical protein
MQAIGLRTFEPMQRRRCDSVSSPALLVPVVFAGSITVAGIHRSVLAGRVSIIAAAPPQIIPVPLLSLRADDRADRSTDYCAGSNAAGTAR